MLTDLTRKNAPIELITVFTEGPASTEALSPLACQLHEEWNAPDHLYERRREEAREATETLAVNRQWLELREALYRDPERTFIDELLSFETAPTDHKTLETLTQLLSEKFEYITQQRTEPVRIFTPLGVGGHLDHLLVHDAVRTATSHLEDTTTLYYEDFPYVLQPKALRTSAIT